MLDLQDIGCHNTNFVTPEHVVPQILEALLIAVERGLRWPLVYNTSAYDSLESIHLMEGLVDIYMPDFKLWDAEKLPEVPRGQRLRRCCAARDRRDACAGRRVESGRAGAGVARRAGAASGHAWAA